MNISIVTCPQCNAMVLNDAARCHVCDHVLDDERLEDDHRPALPTDSAVAEDLETCVSCGETYRRGLVRCWNCGTFTRDEIKEAYEKMTADPERYQAPEDAGKSTEPVSADVPQPSSWAVETDKASAAFVSNEDDEFDASDDDFSFELADSIQMTEAVVRQPAVEEESEDEGYALAGGIPLLEEHSAAAASEIPPLMGDVPEATEADPKPTAAREKQPEPEVSHSEATGGDVLLEIARQEEADITKSRRQFSDKVLGSFIVYCPMGCRIRVHERHRGKAGKCPKCHSVFFVPRSRPKTKAGAGPSATKPETEAPPILEKWRGGQDDVHLHAVVPQKLRIKADSLLNDFTSVDVVMSADGLLLATLVSAPGFLGANLKKKPAIRTALQDHLKTVGTVEGAPVAAVRFIAVEQLPQLAMAQPSPADVESLFGNIPVFGNGRIAVRLPREGDEPATQYLSFTLSEFRQFVSNLESVCGVSGLGSDTEVPLTETYNTVQCHYSEAPVRELLGLEYYQKDPSIELQISGWRCGGCALVVSEDSRKKEKIGGLNGKSIASAKCPKCAAKFGRHPLYELKAPAAPGAPVQEAAEAVQS